jgi:XK-related protein.
VICCITLVLFRMSSVLIVDNKSDYYNKEEEDRLKDPEGPEKTCARDDVDYAPNNAHVTNFDILALIVSVVSHIIDVGLDINIAYRYFHSGQSVYFVLTVVFILFPALVNTVISIRM